MPYKARFGSKQREEIWAREALAAHHAGRGDHPICTLCDQPVTADQAWDESRSRAAGDRVIGVAHCKCDRLRGFVAAPPSSSKSKRVRRLHNNITGPGLGRCPMQAGRRSLVSKTMGHGVQPRLTGAQKHARYLASRELVMVEGFSEPLEVFS